VQAYVAVIRDRSQAAGRRRYRRIARGFLVVTLNPAAPATTPRERRCERARHIVALLTSGPGWIASPYPVTPYHADYSSTPTSSVEKVVGDCGADG